MTKCPQCGGVTKTRREPAYRYAESGLSNVVLIKAVTTTSCSKCGEVYTGFRAIERLHKAIATALIRKKGRLAPEEIRFLRKSLGWSGVDFARRMGTTKETVSRWESGKLPMGPQADRLLRMLVAKSTPVEHGRRSLTGGRERTGETGESRARGRSERMDVPPGAGVGKLTTR